MVLSNLANAIRILGEAQGKLPEKRVLQSVFSEVGSRIDKALSDLRDNGYQIDVTSNGGYTFKRKQNEQKGAILVGPGSYEFVRISEGYKGKYKVLVKAGPAGVLIGVFSLFEAELRATIINDAIIKLNASKAEPKQDALDLFLVGPEVTEDSREKIGIGMNTILTIGQHSHAIRKWAVLSGINATTLITRCKTGYKEGRLSHCLFSPVSEKQQEISLAGATDKNPTDIEKFNQFRRIYGDLPVSIQMDA